MKYEQPVHTGEHGPGCSPQNETSANFSDGARYAQEISSALISRDFVLAGELIQQVCKEINDALGKASGNLEAIAILEEQAVDSVAKLSRGSLLEFSQAFPNDQNLREGLDRVDSTLAEIRHERTKATLDLAGPNTEKLWQLVMDKYPELSQLDLLAHTGSETMSHKSGDFTNPDAVTVQLDEAYYKAAFEKRERSIEIMAERLGVPFSEFTEEHLRMFTLAHELGHAHDLRNNFGADYSLALRDYKVRRRADLRELFIPGFSPTKLEQVIDSTSWDDLTGKYPQLGEMTAQKAVEKQEESYRDLSSEQYADTFAANVIREHISEFEF